jgi:hypothetical protein
MEVFMAVNVLDFILPPSLGSIPKIKAFISSKRLYPNTRLHSVTAQKTAVWILNLWASLNVKDHFWHPYKQQVNYSCMCFKIFVLLGGRQEGERLFLWNLLRVSGQFISLRHSGYYRPMYHLLENKKSTFRPQMCVWFSYDYQNKQR